MYSEGKQKAKIGSVQVFIRNGSYRIRFTYPTGKRHDLAIAKANDDGWVTAIRAAKLIDRDINLGDFDDSYARYSPKHAKSIEVASRPKELNLLELWQLYKKAKKDTVAQTTQKNHWRVTSRAIELLSAKALDINNPELALKELLEVYKKGTIARICTDINSAINLAVARELIAKNPYHRVADSISKIRKEAKLDSIECFETHEIKAIIAAFYADDYCSTKSAYKHSYYAHFVEFLALTGARLEEVIALTHGDIKNQNNRLLIRFNKAYSNGVLLPHTKNRAVRLFPCNRQLSELIDSIHPKGELLFPTVENSYIDTGNFRNRYWKPVLDGLVADGKIQKYLKAYCLRHSFITRLIRDGVDIATVAALVGNSPDVIISNYLAAKKIFDIPEF
ncbi:MAG: tyrosine-type recombinase/integrase [Xenococcaceae cyanobacterium]